MRALGMLPLHYLTGMVFILNRCADNSEGEIGWNAQVKRAVVDVWSEHAQTASGYLSWRVCVLSIDLVVYVSHRHGTVKSTPDSHVT